MASADEIIRRLGLVPLPDEGGFFRETHRDEHSTAIYYFITPESFSSLHAVRKIEIWHFYAGDPAKMVQVHPGGKVKEVVIGPDLASGQSTQVVVPANVWQGTRLLPGGKWALFGCTVAPAFQFEDFTAPDPEAIRGAVGAAWPRIEEYFRS